MEEFSPHLVHEPLLAAAPRVMGFREGRVERTGFSAWREQLAAQLRQLVGTMPAACPLNVRIVKDEKGAGFREIELVFTAEAHADVPCHLLIPEGARDVPVMICLQGHSPGVHISLGRMQRPEEAKTLAGDRDFAIQAVRQGFAALAIEQRAFGRRKDSRSEHDKQRLPGCVHPSMTALLLGRTMIGERVWDVMRAIDVLESLAEEMRLDTGRIACMGNSGGGTITWYATALEPRIKAAMPSCAVCTFAASIGSIGHCVDNYLPRALEYFDMQDVAGLICPRPLVVVAGKEDSIFPLAGVEEAYRTIADIYAAGGAGGGEKCALVVGPGGHRFYAELAWPTFRKLTGW